jgi:hypothetical protein
LTSCAFANPNANTATAVKIFFSLTFLLKLKKHI